MRNPLFNSAVALVAASLTGAAFAGGDAATEHDRPMAPQANQPAEVQVDVQTDANTDDAIQAGSELNGQSDHDATIELQRSDDQAIGASGEIRDSDQDRIDATRDRVREELDREATGASGELRPESQDRSLDTPRDRDLNTDPHQQNIGAEGSVDLGDSDRSSTYGETGIQRDDDAIGAGGTIEMEEPDRSSTPYDRTDMQRDSDTGIRGEVRTQEDAVYRTDRADRPSSRENGLGVQGEVDVDADAQPAGARLEGDMGRDPSRNDDWKWNSDKPHLQVNDPDKPHLSD